MQRKTREHAPMIRRSPLLALFVLLSITGTLASCANGDGATAHKATTSTSTPQRRPTPLLDAPDGKLADAKCWWDLSGIDPSVTVSCHTLTVPADWADPGASKRVVLPIARLHSKKLTGDAGPLVVLHGGPGSSLLSGPPISASQDALVTRHDVIFYDQRGGGLATPNLNCPEKERAVMDALTTTDPVAVELKRNVEATQACRDRLVGEGIDLDDFNTNASVNDLEAIRRAFAIDKWNVSGGSYGTRLGLAYARQFPGRVRALALDSVYPPQVADLARVKAMPSAALDRLVVACADDVECAGVHPDLARTIEDAAASLDRDPGVVSMSLEVAGEKKERTYRVVGSDFRSGMFAALYDTSIIPLLPGVIGGVASGDRSILPTFLQTAAPRLTGLSEGAYLSIDCADSGRLLGGATAEDVVGDGRFFIYAMVLSQTFCKQWDVTPLPATFNEPALPDVPTIIFAGTLDPVTPYTDSKTQAEAMPDARFVSVPRGGHGDVAFDDCTAQYYRDFLADPATPTPTCVSHLEPKRFLVGK